MATERLALDFLANLIGGEPLARAELLLGLSAERRYVNDAGRAKREQQRRTQRRAYQAAWKRLDRAAS